jgi:hypothetical protein
MGILIFFFFADKFLCLLSDTSKVALLTVLHSAQRFYMGVIGALPPIVNFPLNQYTKNVFC